MYLDCRSGESHWCCCIAVRSTMTSKMLLCFTKRMRSNNMNIALDCREGVRISLREWSLISVEFFARVAPREALITTNAQAVPVRSGEPFSLALRAAALDMIICLVLFREEDLLFLLPWALVICLPHKITWTATHTDVFKKRGYGGLNVKKIRMISFPV